MEVRSQEGHHRQGDPVTAWGPRVEGALEQRQVGFWVFRALPLRCPICLEISSTGRLKFGLVMH